MSLFQFGFKRKLSSSTGLEPASSCQASSHQITTMPTLEESGLGQIEYNHVSEKVSNLVDQTSTEGEPSSKKKTRGPYTMYTPEDRAQIGKYALENGNERARRNF